MTKICLKIAIIVLFFIVGKLSAQTVNTGDISILPGTEFATVSEFDNKSTGDFVNDGKFIVYSNYNNDGLVSFRPELTTGLTYFKGTGETQNITGAELSEFYSVRFENKKIQRAFLLSTVISIYGVCDFYSGIVSNNNSAGTFIFEADATHHNASDESYVNGYIQRNGNNEFQFPIGDEGFFRPADIGETNLKKNVFRSKYLFKNSNDLKPHIQKEDLIIAIDAKEYWEVTSNQSEVDLALTLTWNTSTTPDELIKEDTNSSLAIVRWDESRTKWKYYSSAVDQKNQTVTAVIDSNGIFTLGRIRVPNMDDDIVIYNAISPNGDGRNDYFNITGLEKFSDNALEIYNRYGVKVFQTSNYGSNGNWFRGISEGRATISKDQGLPTGTYFYILKIKMTNGSYKDKAGYLYINSD